MFFLNPVYVAARSLRSLRSNNSKARFKRRILHAPNRIAQLSACKMRRLNQLNATYFNSMRVQSNIRLIQSNIRLKFDS